MKLDELNENMNVELFKKSINYKIIEDGFCCYKTVKFIS